MSNEYGYLEVTIGPMMSEKSTDLFSILKINGMVRRCLFVSHKADNRNGTEAFSTHNDMIKSTLPDHINADMMKVSELSKLPDILLKDYRVVGIDEGQFFPDIVPAVTHMVEDLNLCVYVFGLNSNFRRQKFGSIVDLASIADEFHISRRGICIDCANFGIKRRSVFTHLLDAKQAEGKDDSVIPGGIDKYIALCRACHIKRTKK